LEGHLLGPTKRCYSTPLRPSASVGLVLNAVYDTLIFLAISFRIASFRWVGENWQTRIKCFFTADGLPWLSRSLIQGGQLYYLASVLSSGVTCILVFAPNIPPFYRAVLTVLSVTLPNVVACRVFRGIRLCFIQEVQPTLFGTTPTISRVHFASGQVPSTIGTLDDSQNLQSIITETKVVDEDPHHFYPHAEQASLGEGVQSIPLIEFKEYASDNV